MTTLIRCPHCNQLRSPGPDCPICAARRAQRQRRLTTLLLSLAGLAFAIALATLLAGCTDTGAAGSGIQPPPRRTLAEIRAESFGAQTTNAAPSAIPTLIIPAPLPPDETDWARNTIQLDYRWCAAGQLQGGTQPQLNHPACPQ